MGIEKLNKKNPPTPASSPRSTSTVEVLTHIMQVPLLIYGGSSTRRTGRGSRRREDQPCKCKLKEIGSFVEHYVLSEFDVEKVHRKEIENIRENAEKTIQPNERNFNTGNLCLVCIH